MVGVPGKFKGCHTCRERRVKCDNLRPECQKCLDSNRVCKGYEREVTWILGTQKERGRCSSHPHRSLLVGAQSRAKKRKAPTSNNAIASDEADFEIQGQMVAIADPIPSEMKALHTNLSTLKPLLTGDQNSFTLSSLEHFLPDPTRSSDGSDFSLRAVCLVRVRTSTTQRRFENSNQASKRTRQVTSQETGWVESDAASQCLFLYDTNLVDEQYGPWKNMLGGSSRLVKQNGPAAYKRFPSNHFFSKLYRPAACCAAMSSRKSTFLIEPEWCRIPWDETPKDDMDRLFDIQVLLPAIFERGEKLEEFPSSISRRLKAIELLKECTQIDKMLSEWYGQLEKDSPTPLYWTSESKQFIDRRDRRRASAAQNIQPLNSLQLNFVDSNTAFLHLYYWAAKALFYRAIQHIHTICSEEIPSFVENPRKQRAREAMRTTPFTPSTSLVSPPPVLPLQSDTSLQARSQPRRPSQPQHQTQHYIHPIQQPVFTPPTQQPLYSAADQQYSGTAYLTTNPKISVYNHYDQNPLLPTSYFENPEVNTEYIEEYSATTHLDFDHFLESSQQTVGGTFDLSGPSHRFSIDSDVLNTSTLIDNNMVTRNSTLPISHPVPSNVPSQLTLIPQTPFHTTTRTTRTPSIASSIHARSTPGTTPHPSPPSISSKLQSTIYTAPPLPLPPPLSSHHTESAVLALSINIARALPYLLRTTLSPRSTPPTQLHLPTEILLPTFSQENINVKLAPQNHTSDELVWPLWCASQVFHRQKYTQEREWCAGLMHTIRDNGRKYVESLSNNTINNSSVWGTSGLKTTVWREWQGGSDDVVVKLEESDFGHFERASSGSMGSMESLGSMGGLGSSNASASWSRSVSRGSIQGDS